MKKLIVLVLSLLITTMTVASFSVVFAEEYTDSNGESPVIKVSEDGEYVSHIFDDVIIVYDLEGNVLVTATYTSFGAPDPIIPNRMVNPNGLISPLSVELYDQWGNWIETEFVQFVPVFSGSSIASGALAATMESAFLAKKIHISGMAISLICGSIADSIVNGQTITVRGDFSYNVYCNILRKERVNQYNANGKVKKYGPETTNWLSSPWDYGTADASCRALANKY